MVTLDQVKTRFDEETIYLYCESYSIGDHTFFIDPNISVNIMNFDEEVWMVTIQIEDYCLYFTSDNSMEGVSKILIHLRYAILSNRTWDSYKSSEHFSRWVYSVPSLIEQTDSGKLKWQALPSGDYETILDGWSIIVSDGLMVAEYPKQIPIKIEVEKVPKLQELFQSIIKKDFS